jgi:hypothetical protein
LNSQKCLSRQGIDLGICEHPLDRLVVREWYPEGLPPLGVHDGLPLRRNRNREVLRRVGKAQTRKELFVWIRPF